ncbi:MAG: hypothetical protein R3E96_15860 [Planctomycetota bacterium]
MAFVRSRHEQMMDGSELRTLVEELTNTAREGQAITGYLGHEHKAELWQELQDQAAMFLTQINSVMGQMTWTPSAYASGPEHWDLNLTSLQQALAAVTAHEQDIAAASSRMSVLVTRAASALTLLSTALLVLRLGQLQARRQRDVEEARFQAIEASEVRLRALLQNSGDLLMVAAVMGPCALRRRRPRCWCPSSTARVPYRSTSCPKPKATGSGRCRNCSAARSRIWSRRAAVRSRSTGRMARSTPMRCRPMTCARRRRSARWCSTAAT